MSGDPDAMSPSFGALQFDCRTFQYCGEAKLDRPATTCVERASLDLFDVGVGAD